MLVILPCPHCQKAFHVQGATDIPDLYGLMVWCPTCNNELDVTPEGVFLTDNYPGPGIRPDILPF